MVKDFNKKIAFLNSILSLCETVKEKINTIIIKNENLMSKNTNKIICAASKHIKISKLDI